MKTIPSSEFRRTYAGVTEPVVVTVNGHPIGTWTPAVTYQNYVASAERSAALSLPTPAPKPGKKR